MAKEVHFEFFHKNGPKASWELVDVFYDRNTVINQAKLKLLQNPNCSVRVMKETFNPEDGQFASVCTYEDGAERLIKEQKIQNDAKLPCFRPEDLYSYHARETISQVLKDLLNRWGITASELIHRADLTEQFEASGTELQHAVQKYSIAFAGENNQPVQELIKQLNDLISQATTRLYQDSRNKLFPKITPKNINQVAEKLSAKSSAKYLLCGGIAYYISSAKSWDEKLSKLLSLLEVTSTGEAANICLPALDQFTAEILSGRAALDDLLGPTKDLGESLLVLADIVLGEAKKHENLQEGVQQLSQQFGQNNLTESRNAIIKRIISELKGIKRLRPDSLEEEVTLARKLATKMSVCEESVLSPKELMNAFSARSKRLLAADVVEPYLAKAETPEEKIQYLLALEENIVGAENKRTLAGFIQPIISSHACESHFVAGKAPILKRLSGITAIQMQILKAGFQDTSKAELAKSLDHLAVLMEERAQLLKSIDQKRSSLIDKTMMLLRLCTNQVFTQGECEKAAKIQILKYMQQKAFKEAVAEATEHGDSQVDDLMALLGKVDMTTLKQDAA